MKVPKARCAVCLYWLVRAVLKDFSHKGELKKALCCGIEREILWGLCFVIVTESDDSAVRFTADTTS